MTETGGQNAADWFVDRHLREGGGASLAFTDPWRSLTYAELRAATLPLRRRAARGRHRAGAADRDADAGHRRFPDRVLGRAACRRRAGADQHAAAARA